MSDTQITENNTYFRNWPLDEEKVSDLKGVLILIHGLGEHCERYGALATALNNAGYALCSMDLPGHGRTEGKAGHIDSFNDYQNAALTLHSKAKEWYPDQPVFLIGHSMGGLIATHLLLDHQSLFNGALLSGAALQSPQAPPSWQISIMKLVALFAPKAGMLKLDADGISRDMAVVEDYMNDPLVSKEKLSARFLVEMFSTMERCKNEAGNIELPIRIMHGSEDPMTAPEGSEFLYNAVSSQDKECVIYKGLMHEIFNEPEQQTIFQEIIAWLDQRI